MTLKERLGLDDDPVFLIDGSAYVYRAFYAYPDLKRSDGFPTNALFIVLRLLLKIIREERPEFLGFFLDGKGPTFRHERYPAYKAQRTATPEGLVAQLPPVQEAVRLLGFHVETSSGCEADDLIASLAARFKTSRPVIIVGADKDLKQCLDANVFLWDPIAKEEKLLSMAGFEAETGLLPSQWADYQAIIGDSSDNIPGIPGVGPKTASRIFKDYPSIEAIAQHLDRLKPTERNKIEPHLDAAYLFRELTTLRTDFAAELSLEALRRREPDPQHLGAFLWEYEFRSLARELAPQYTAPRRAPLAPAPAARTPETPAREPGGGQQFSLFSIGASAAPAAPVKQAGTALPDLTGRRVGLAMAGERFVLGVGDAGGGGEAEYDAGEAAPALIEALTAAERVYCAEIKPLFAADPAWEALPLALWFDLSLAAYLLNPEERDYSLEHLSRRFGPDLPAPPHRENIGLMTLALGQELEVKLAAASLDRLLRELEMPLAPVLARMERRGVLVDLAAFASFLADVQAELDRATGEVFAAAGGPFNLRSSQQLGQLLFEQLKLKPAGKTPGGAASTSQEALERLEGSHPVIAPILEFRRLEKLRSTYLEPFPKLVHDDGRVRTTFNQLATATGRLSSSNPNLQNIPIRGEQGRRMRRCFCAPPGALLVAADYSQIELRVLAHLSQDPTLLAAFREGQDIHSRTASLLFDKTADAVSADERRNAKTINFGLIYGMGPQKLARELGLSVKQAKAFIERYFSRLTGLREFYDQVEAEAKAQGAVTTICGRRRLLPDIDSRNAQMQSAARRQAINTRIQGSAADIIKMAMLRAEADERLQNLGARLILQVHDELVLEAPEAAAREAGERLAGIMSAVQPGGEALSVPLVVDWGCGSTWGDAH